ncbi:MAG: aminoglycoside phosphotransferase, partial [Promicromonosporaceae bacterium]|nr:aminoglycoside phosphotransferase [Promicromonosporaceae bacterium]
EVSLAPVGPPEAHLAMVAALVPEAHDGFELACQYAGRGESFAELAATLGATIAELHAALRRALPVNEALNVTDFCCLLRRRAIAAIDIAFEALVPHEAAILDVYDNLEHVLNSASKPARLQHIHGDLHLGQTLLGADGWQVLDFEGEPQRPVAERTQPDLPLRDVAGMLRSFDYAAVVGDCPDPAWVGEAQAAFLAAYRQASDMPNDHMSSAILNALVLDKSLYEVVYETRQRPHWVHIPLAAVEQILVGSRKVVP